MCKLFDDGLVLAGQVSEEHMISRFNKNVTQVNFKDDRPSTPFEVGIINVDSDNSSE
jgi:hypothetical protein